MTFIERLEDAVAPGRARILGSRLLKALFADDPISIELWKTYLWESYHYVKHNGVNQALAVLRTDLGQKPLMRRYLRHALEELDHEEMCLHDLDKLGVPRGQVIASRPLAETAAFTSFLYDFVMRDDPMGRLGYSFWAEGSNEMSGHVVARLRHHFALPDDHMTFVLAHADLDRGHAEACRRTIEEFARTAEQQDTIVWFAQATCRQFAHVLDAMYELGMERARAAVSGRI